MSGQHTARNTLLREAAVLVRREHSQEDDEAIDRQGRAGLAIRNASDELKTEIERLKARLDECADVLIGMGLDGPGVIGGILHLKEQRDELLEALRLTLPLASTLGGATTIPESAWVLARDAARAAIKKATGAQEVRDA